jgi:hypothetical protein
MQGFAIALPVGGQGLPQPAISAQWQPLERIYLVVKVVLPACVYLPYTDLNRKPGADLVHAQSL